MARSTAYSVALLATAVALGPAFAHLFELPAKIGMDRGDDLPDRRGADHQWWHIFKSIGISMDLWHKTYLMP
jgi:hypothetical protein